MINYNSRKSINTSGSVKINSITSRKNQFQKIIQYSSQVCGINKRYIHLVSLHIQDILCPLFFCTFYGSYCAARKFISMKKQSVVLLVSFHSYYIDIHLKPSEYVHKKCFSSLITNIVYRKLILLSQPGSILLSIITSELVFYYPDSYTAVAAATTRVSMPTY